MQGDTMDQEQIEVLAKETVKGVKIEADELSV